MPRPTDFEHADPNYVRPLPVRAPLAVRICLERPVLGTIPRLSANLQLASVRSELTVRRFEDRPKLEEVELARDGGLKNSDFRVCASWEACTGRARHPVARRLGSG